MKKKFDSFLRYLSSIIASKRFVLCMASNKWLHTVDTAISWIDFLAVKDTILD